MSKTHKVYYPLYNDKEHFIILITGSRASGKSFSASQFIERLTFEYNPTLKIAHQILYTRYTMVSAAISVIPEVKEKIDIDGTQDYFKSTKTDIVNRMTGATIMFRGINTSSGNQTAKLKSIHGVTTFVVDEAEEWTSEEDFERIMLSIRQKGLQNRVIIIMNPSDSNHWVYKRFIEKTHKEVYYDGVPVQISTDPRVLHIHTTYLDNIEHLSPEFLNEVMEMRENEPEKYAHIMIGRWCDVAEGAVFKHVGIVDKFPENAKKVAIGVDWGYSKDYTAIVKCGIVGNRLYIEELCYKTEMLSSDIIKFLRPYADEGLFVYADSADPRLIDEVALGGIVIYGAQKGAGSILAGIDKMQTFEIFTTKKSVHLQSEFRNYIWAKDKDGRYINTPEDHDNHCFTADTLILTNQGYKQIKDINVGDVVYNSDGWHLVSKTFDNGIQEVWKTIIELDDRTIEINSTPSHKFKTKEGWKQLQDLTEKDVLYIFRNSMDENMLNTQKKGILRMERQLLGFIELCGNIIMDVFRKAIMYITKTKMFLTMKLIISNSLRRISILVCTRKRKCKMLNILSNCKRKWITQEDLQANGMVQKKERNGIDCMVLKSQIIYQHKNISVCIVARHIKQSLLAIINSAQTLVKQGTDTILRWIMKKEPVNIVGRNSLLTNTSKKSIAQINAIGKIDEQKIKRIKIVRKYKEHVYNMEVEGEHEYFANNILVSNCIDAARYYTLAVLLGKVMKPRNIDKKDLGVF